jgi:tetratricopeptide (TPR) repeat protein
MFERAIEIDPTYAPAYAGLTQILGWSYEWWGGGEAAAEAADVASSKALEHGPQLSESHAARGGFLALRRRYDEAMVEFEEALRLNPNSFETLYFYGRAAFAAGHIERSAEVFRRGGEIQPEDFQCPILLSQSLRMMGKKEEASAANWEGIRRAERWLEIEPGNVRALSLAGNALMDEGEHERSLEWSRRAMALAPDDVGVNVNGACSLAKMGKKEEAIAALERMFSRGWGKRDWIEHDPDYDSLRDDPRFHAMLEKLS